MNDDLLERYIKKSLSSDENFKVEEWINQNEVNKEYYDTLLKIYMLEESIDSQDINSDLSLKQGLNNTRHKILKIKFMSSFKKVALSLSVIIIIVIATLYVNKNIESNNASNIADIIHKTSIIKKTGDKPNILEIYTNKGVKGVIMLPDSSRVWLNSDTKLYYPQTFSEDVRKVKLVGEAYFEVKTNPKCPMIVETGNGVKVEVLGTKFLIRSYEDDYVTKATLFSGSINLHVDSKKNGKGRKITKMFPMETVIINNKQDLTLIPKSDTTKIIAWKQGLLMFDNVPLNLVFKDLERWHGVKFIVEDESIYKYHLTAQFKQESIVQIMQIIKYCTPVDYVKTDENIIVKKRRNI